MIRFLARLVLRTVVGVVSLTVLGGTGFLAGLYFLGTDLPDCRHLADYRPPVVTRLYSADGRLFQEYAREKRVFVPVHAIPRRVIHAFLAAEDKNFYDHHGIDLQGTLRAILTNVLNAGTGQRLKGASTITQQVAKNFFLDNGLSWVRKIREAILAFRIERTLTKDRILELYLNQIYLGSGAYGVAAASLKYFNKSLHELSIAETAFLAGLPKAPSRYHPTRDAEAAIIRRDWVLRRMLEENLIHEREMELARATEIQLHQPDSQDGVEAACFAEEVRRMLAARHGENVLYQGGLTVRTTLDPALQKQAEQALKEGLEGYDRRHGYRGPLGRVPSESSLTLAQAREALKTWPRPPGAGSWILALVRSVSDTSARIITPAEEGTIPLSEVLWARKALDGGGRGPEIAKMQDVLHPGDVVLVAPAREGYTLCQVPQVNGALVAMDPRTGRVLALLGGYDTRTSAFNRASQAMRQPGSAFKPFVYLAALERGFSPVTILQDSPLRIDLGGALGVWEPRNVDKRFLGPRTLRTGLEHSRNLMTIRLAQALGMVHVKKTAERFGVMDDIPLQLAVVLGSGETTLMRLTNGFARIANGGYPVDPVLVDRIQDRDGQTLYRSDTRTFDPCPPRTGRVPELEEKRQPLAHPHSICQLTSMLEGVIQRGTGYRAKDLGRPVAGKTGSSNRNRSTWFVGFTPDLVVGVFVGFDDNRPLGEREGGSHTATAVFADLMRRWGEGRPAVPFRIPPGLKMVRVDPATGQPSRGPQAVFEIFRPHQKPNTPQGEALVPQPGEPALPADDDETEDDPGGGTPPPPASGGPAEEGVY